MDELLVSVFLESYDVPPKEIVLDVDTTNLPLHGKQEGRFFHGYHQLAAEGKINAPDGRLAQVCESHTLGYPKKIWPR